MKTPPIHMLMWALVLAIGLTGCATRYTLSSPDMSGIQGSIDLPNGAADRLILRVDNPDKTWLHLDWSGATIVGLTGFAFPTDLKPKNPLSTVPPRSSVEYHAFPGHNYTPRGQFMFRRSGVERLLVFDADFAKLGQSGSLTFHIPVCRGDAQACEDSGESWSMATISGTVRRRL